MLPTCNAGVGEVADFLITVIEWMGECKRERASESASERLANRSGWVSE